VADKSCPSYRCVKRTIKDIPLGPQASFHKNTAIKGFVTDEMFKQYKRYYEIDYGRTFKDAEDVDKYLQAHRWPEP